MNSQELLSSVAKKLPATPFEPLSATGNVCFESVGVWEHEHSVHQSRIKFASPGE